MKRLMDRLGILEVPESWAQNYGDAMADMPASPLPFLQAEYLLEVRKYIYLSDVRMELLKEAFRLIHQDEDFKRIAWLWHYMIFLKPDAFSEQVAGWPAPAPTKPGLKTAANFFPAVVLLSGFPKILNLYREHKLPEEVLRKSLEKIEAYMSIYEEESGKTGMSMHYFNWLLKYFRGQIFSVGRLEFEMRPFKFPIRVYQNKFDRSIASLSEDGVNYRKDGLIDGTNGVSDESGGWRASLLENKDGIEGFPLALKDGTIGKDRIQLSKQEWVLKLRQDDPVLHVHILPFGSFTAEDIFDSFTRARDFFAKHYPDRPYTAVVCVSWLLDPQLRELLKSTSNLLKFQAWYHLFPVKSGDESIYKFVYRSEKRDVETLPETTSLQRKMKAFMLAGGRFHLAGGFILREELESDELSRKFAEVENTGS